MVDIRWPESLASGKHGREGTSRSNSAFPMGRVTTVSFLRYCSEIRWVRIREMVVVSLCQGAELPHDLSGWLLASIGCLRRMPELSTARRTTLSVYLCGWVRPAVEGSWHLPVASSRTTRLSSQMRRLVPWRHSFTVATATLAGRQTVCRLVSNAIGGRSGVPGSGTHFNWEGDRRTIKVWAPRGRLPRKWTAKG